MIFSQTVRCIFWVKKIHNPPILKFLPFLMAEIRRSPPEMYQTLVSKLEMLPTSTGERWTF